jgi:hypothetical protein
MMKHAIAARKSKNFILQFEGHSKVIDYLRTPAIEKT